MSNQQFSATGHHRMNRSSVPCSVSPVRMMGMKKLTPYRTLGKTIQDHLHTESFSKSHTLNSGRSQIGIVFSYSSPDLIVLNHFVVVNEMAALLRQTYQDAMWGGKIDGGLFLDGGGHLKNKNFRHQETSTMANKRYVPPDPNQMELDLKFKQKFNRLIESTRELGESMSEDKQEYLEGSDIAGCYAVAETIKKMIREAGFSVEQMVDKINAFFGRSAELASHDKPGCLKPLTVPYFKNYLSKPAESRIPAYYVFAIQHICGSLCLAKLFTAAMGGEVITAEENRLLLIAKVQEKQREMKEIEIALKKRAAY